MNGVAVISQLTIDCIYADFPRFPEKGEELYAKHFEMTLGGGACVTPIRLSKMGVPTRFGTFFGEDMLSATARMLLDKYGATNVHNFYKGDKSPVIFSTIYSYPDDRGILTYDSGIGEDSLSNDEIYDFLKGADVCFAPQRPEILKKLQADGTKTVYDVHWEEGQTLDDHKAVLRYADMFTPNDKEAMFLTNTDTPEDALRVLCEYTKQPIVKIGKKGCCTMIDGEIQYFPAGEATPIDKTGAGDNFLAGLVFGMYHKLPVGECIRLANIAGALSTEAHGCFSAKYDLNDYLR